MSLSGHFPIRRPRGVSCKGSPRGGFHVADVPGPKITFGSVRRMKPPQASGMTPGPVVRLSFPPPFVIRTVNIHPPCGSPLQYVGCDEDDDLVVSH